ncbi:MULTISPECIES: hypothetical protein [unclassified Janthinobacterium]|uniref:hypothetical protein n=1 Tax=unclassified Janthinobacterium TaxID=2610881 RepID=UPI001617EDCF|nr:MULTISPECIES: hypothetical protein [unclassified Janthinobacterium]MBB5610960.1 hypothetical protein [Janthinobacterium sp. S3T4]MBB5616435.1 hypothetical protein [Janthinobacterium sp. S3M3]
MLSNSVRFLFSIPCLIVTAAMAVIGISQVYAQVTEIPKISFPSVKQMTSKSVVPTYLDTYKLKKYQLTCNLPDGSPASVVLVDDSEDFSFLAIRTAHGPTIMANERYIPQRDTAYAVFSFYRECGIHALENVRATNPGNANMYDIRTLKNAECLAVMPAQVTLRGTSLPFNLIVSRLAAEYGDKNVSSGEQLKRCANREYVSELSKNLLRATNPKP